MHADNGSRFITFFYASAFFYSLRATGEAGCRFEDFLQLFQQNPDIALAFCFSLLSSFFLSLLLMPMPMMDIWHVIVLMFLGGMFMLMRVDFHCGVMSMRGIVMAVTVIMEHGRMCV